ncbi:MAG: VOC family protein [Chitinophagales bacterium]
MKRASLIVFVVIVSFLSGFSFKSMLTKQQNAETEKVTGIGGIFFKCKDPKKMKEWYRQHLGFNTDAYGATFEWYERKDSTRKAQTQWTPFSEKTTYFAPSTKDFMINYRVKNLEVLVAELKKENVTIVDSLETYDYGKFIHIMDPENNKIELWEPIN